MLAHETNRKRGVVIEALARLLSMPEVNWHVSPTEQLENFRSLSDHLSSTFESRGQKLKDAVFITDADAQGSSHSATYLFRLANGMEGKEYDHQFLSLKAAAALKDRTNRPIVYLDDMIYTGNSMAGRNGRVDAIAKALKVDTNQVTVGVGGVHENGFNTVTDKGIDVVFGREYIDTYQALKAKVANNELEIRTNKVADSKTPVFADPTDALKPSIGEGWKGDGTNKIDNPVTSSVSTPVMVANNSSPLVVRVAQYHGLARANMLAIEAQTEEATARLEQHSMQKKASTAAQRQFEIQAKRAEAGQKSTAIKRTKAKPPASEAVGNVGDVPPSVSTESASATSEAAPEAKVAAPEATSAEAANPTSGGDLHANGGTEPPVTPKLAAQLQEFRQNLDSLMSGDPTDEEIKFALDFAVDGHENDPEWKGFRDIMESYYDGKSATHESAVESLKTQIAGARFAKSGFGDQLKELWGSEFGGLPSDDPENLKFALDYFRMELLGDPEAATVLPSYERLMNGAESDKPATRDMALSVLNQLLH